MLLYAVAVAKAIGQSNALLSFVPFLLSLSSDSRFQQRLTFSIKNGEKPVFHRKKSEYWTFLELLAFAKLFSQLR
jgi:hypothetical protein